MNPSKSCVLLMSLLVLFLSTYSISLQAHPRPYYHCHFHRGHHYCHRNPFHRNQHCWRDSRGRVRCHPGQNDPFRRCWRDSRGNLRCR